jgi:hypothetical protein
MAFSRDAKVQEREGLGGVMFIAHHGTEWLSAVLCAAILGQTLPVIVRRAHRAYLCLLALLTCEEDRLMCLSNQKICKCYQPALPERMTCCKLRREETR